MDCVLSQYMKTLVPIIYLVWTNMSDEDNKEWLPSQELVSCSRVLLHAYCHVKSKISEGEEKACKQHLLAKS